MHAFLLLAALCADPDIESMKRSLEAQIGMYQRINDLERRVTKLEQKGGDPIVVTPHEADSGAVKHEASSDPAPVPTTVCRCMGFNESVCLCRKAGVACHCSRSVGSVWALNEQGQATHKTGAKADPRREASAIARSDAPAASAPSIRITVADFHCPACDVLKGYDWSDFNVEWQTGGAQAYPQISWLDKRGTRRVLTGAYKPSRVMWSWKATQ